MPSSVLVAGRDRRAGHPLAGRVGDPHLVAAVDVDVLDARVAQVGGQRAEPVALVVDGLAQRLALGRGEGTRPPARTWRSDPARTALADDRGRLGLADAVVQPAGDMAEDLGDAPRNRASASAACGRGLRPRRRTVAGSQVHVGHRPPPVPPLPPAGPSCGGRPFGEPPGALPFGEWPLTELPLAVLPFGVAAGPRYALRCGRRGPARPGTVRGQAAAGVGVVGQAGGVPSARPDQPEPDGRASGQSSSGQLGAGQPAAWSGSSGCRPPPLRDLVRLVRLTRPAPIRGPVRLVRLTPLRAIPPPGRACRADPARAAAGLVARAGRRPAGAARHRPVRRREARPVRRERPDPGGRAPAGLRGREPQRRSG